MSGRLAWLGVVCPKRLHLVEAHPSHFTAGKAGAMVECTGCGETHFFPWDGSEIQR